MTYNHYIDGEWTDGQGEETFESTDPATGDVLAEFQQGTKADVDTAVAAAD